MNDQSSIEELRALRKQMSRERKLVARARSQGAETAANDNSDSSWAGLKIRLARALRVLGLLALVAGLVYAAPPVARSYAQASQAGMTPCGTAITLSATGVSSNAQLSSCGGETLVWNIGSTEVFYTYGAGATTAATTSNWSLPPGSFVNLNLSVSRPFLAVITAGGSSTVRVTQGLGQLLAGVSGGTIAAGTAVIGKVGIDQTTPGTTNGVAIAPSSAAGVGITPVVGGSAVSGLVLKNAAGNLYDVYATSTATSFWLMVFNSTNVPSNGATTAGTASGNMVQCIQSNSSGTALLTFGSGPPEVYSVGISAAVSSTACATLTLSATAFIRGRVQ